MIEADVINNILAEIQAAKKVNIKGKNYSVISQRVEVFRKHTGFEYGINTELLKYGTEIGEKIVMKATIVNKDGFQIGSGTAEEIIGGGFHELGSDKNINTTSALEVAETSSIGRALASLSIHGGEYASLNEIEIAQGKKEKMNKNPKPEGDPKDKLAAATKYVEQQIEKIQSMNANALVVWTQQESDNLKSLADLDKNLHTKLFNAYKERKQDAVSA